MAKNLTNEIKIEAAESCLDLKEEADRVLKALAEAKKTLLYCYFNLVRQSSRLW